MLTVAEREGEGVKNNHKFADVICERSLRLMAYYKPANPVGGSILPRSKYSQYFITYDYVSSVY